MATTVYNVEEIELQDGTVVKLKPLSITQLRKFMTVINKASQLQNDEEGFDVLVEACGIALSTQIPDLIANKEAFESALDVPTINKIIEVCGGIKMDDETLVAAAVLGSGQN